jgi:ubiquinone/menaquinone biosynthesis C-methylase UbiE
MVINNSNIKKKKKLFNKLNKKLNLKNYLGEEIMDFGCGGGEITYFISKTYPKKNIIGFDINKEAIKESKLNYKNKNLFYTPSFSKKRFDCILAIKSLHETDNLKKELRNIYKLLKKEGRIIIYEFRKCSKDKLREKYNSKKRDISFKEFYKKHYRWSLEEFKDLLEETGFKTLFIKKDSSCYLSYGGIKW